MMARRHEIETRLTAKDKTKAAFNRVQNRMKKLKKTSMIAGAGVAALAAGLAMAARRAVNFGDNIAKTANKLGIGTTAFQEMRLATDLAGVSSGQFESALGAMSKRIGELRIGTGTLFTVMQKLNDDAFRKQIVSTKDNSEAFRLFIGRIASLKNAQDRAALSAAAFGRTAGIALSKLSLEELDKGVAIAREFGIAIDENLLREAEKLKDAFTVAASVFQKQFFSELLRAMKSIDLKQFAIDMARIAGASIRTAIELAKVFGVITRSRVEVLTTRIAQLTVSIRKHKAQLSDTGKTLNKSGKAYKDLEGYLAGLIAKMKAYRAELKALTDPVPFSKTSESWEVPEKSDDEKKADATAATEKLQAVLDKYRAGLVLTNETLKDLNKTKFKTIEALDAYTLELNTTAAVETKLGELRAKNLPIDEKVEAKILALALANDKLTASLQRKRDAMKPGPIQEYIGSIESMRVSLETVAVQGADRLTESIMAFQRGTMSAKEAFKQFANSVIAHLQRMLIKKLIVDRIFGYISAAIGPTPAVPAKATGRPRATGGPVARGRPYMVGERGPELMVPRRAGTIVPNNALGGGAVVHQTINIETGVSQTVRAEIMQLMPQISESTKAAVLDARRRGGAFAAGFG